MIKKEFNLKTHHDKDKWIIKLLREKKEWNFQRIYN